MPVIIDALLISLIHIWETASRMTTVNGTEQQDSIRKRLPQGESKTRDEKISNELQIPISHVPPRLDRGKSEATYTN